MGYVEFNLQIPGIRGYNEDMLLLVIPTMTHSKKVLVMVGSKIFDRAMGIIMKGKLVKATVTWKQAHFGAVMSGSLQLPHKGTRGWGAERGVADPTVPKEFCLDDIQGHVHTTQRVTISPFGTIDIHSKTDI